ncbi:hypothetical protein G9A89_009267 [Geosiphon pyriformis]|nr:hypothetical protein G9A89_009267 [Geosiphon pyriformis]
MAGGTLWRNTIWTIIGLREYTKHGYERNSKKFNMNACNVDLTGKITVVTGANAGLGKYVAAELYKRGAIVHMLCRDQARGEKARQDIINAVTTDESNTATTDGSKEAESAKNTPIMLKEDSLKLHQVDISNLKNVQKFVEELSKGENSEENSGKCHILINNAGVMNNERRLTPYGVETNFAINTIGTYYLTKCMIPLLEKAGPGSRVVTVSSGGMYTNKLDLTDLQFEKLKPFDGTMAYAQNKRQQVELTEYWSKKYPEQKIGIKFLATHPGWSDTPGLSVAMEGFYKRVKTLLRSIPQGCDTILWAAFSNEADKVPSGSFLFDRQIASKHLPLAKTRSKPQDVEELVDKLDHFSEIGLQTQ